MKGVLYFIEFFRGHENAIEAAGSFVHEVLSSLSEEEQDAEGHKDTVLST